LLTKTSGSFVPLRALERPTVVGSPATGSCRRVGVAAESTGDAVALLEAEPPMKVAYWMPGSMIRSGRAGSCRAKPKRRPFTTSGSRRQRACPPPPVRDGPRVGQRPSGVWIESAPLCASAIRRAPATERIRTAVARRHAELVLQRPPYWRTRGRSRTRGAVDELAVGGTFSPAHGSGTVE